MARNRLFLIFYTHNYDPSEIRFGGCCNRARELQLQGSFLRNVVKIPPPVSVVVQNVHGNTDGRHSTEFGFRFPKTWGLNKKLSIAFITSLAIFEIPFQRTTCICIQQPRERYTALGISCKTRYSQRLLLWKVSANTTTPHPLPICFKRGTEFQNELINYIIHL